VDVPLEEDLAPEQEVREQQGQEPGEDERRVE
jgi:hypothetical protein